MRSIGLLASLVEKSFLLLGNLLGLMWSTTFGKRETTNLLKGLIGALTSFESFDIRIVVSQLRYVKFSNLNLVPFRNWHIPLLFFFYSSHDPMFSSVVIFRIITL